MPHFKSQFLASCLYQRKPFQKLRVGNCNDLNAHRISILPVLIFLFLLPREGGHVPSWWCTMNGAGSNWIFFFFLRFLLLFGWNIDHGRSHGPVRSHGPFLGGTSFLIVLHLFKKKHFFSAPINDVVPKEQLQ